LTQEAPLLAGRIAEWKVWKTVAAILVVVELM